MKKLEKSGKEEEGEWLQIKIIYNRQWRKIEEKSKYYKGWKDSQNKKKNLLMKAGGLYNANKL